MHILPGNISSNSEANASESVEKLEEMLLIIDVDDEHFSRL